MSRTTTMRVLLSIALACSALFTHGAANIDVGFAQDGATTYCQGVHGAESNPLEFPELELTSAGRCPIDVKLDIKVTTVGQQAPLEVAWSATAHTGDVPGNIFPHAVDAVTKKPQNVIAYLLRACKAGTNCAVDSMVVPQLAEPTDNGVGPFDAQNRKEMPLFRFLFSASGHYVIVAMVVLPGDSTLNVSASEFITFQRVTVVDGVGPATVSPPTQTAGGGGAHASAAAGEVGAEGRTDNLNFHSDLAKTTTTTTVSAASEPKSSLTPSPATTPAASASTGTSVSAVDASFSGNGKSSDAKSVNVESSSSGGGGSGSGKMMIWLIVVVLVAIVIGAIVFFIVGRKKNHKMNGMIPPKPLDPSGEVGIFRLTMTGNNDMASMASSQTSQGRGSAYAARSLPPPRLPGRSSAADSASFRPSLAPPRLTGRSSSAESGPFRQQPRQPSSQYSSYENPAYIATGREFKPDDRMPSIVSLASSGFSDFDDKDADRRRSSRSSYRDSGISDFRMSSRLYSEASTKAPARGVSEFSIGFSDRDSDLRRSTELDALSERGSSAFVI